MEKLPKNVDYHFLIRVLNDEVSPEEKEFFEAWLAESDKNREDFSQVALLWDKVGSTESPKPPDPFEQWEKIKSEVETIQNEFSVFDPPMDPENPNRLKIIRMEKFHDNVRRRIFTSNLIKVAAVLVLMLTASLPILYPHKQADIPIVPQIGQIKMYEAVTRRGERVTITLADGSRVYVNADSKIIYPNTFGEESRDIELTGEAYFSVVHDADKPFRVKSGNTLTVVRGTEFNIKNRKNKVSIVVAKGSVDASSPVFDKKYNLKKGDMVSFNDQTGFTAPHQVDLKKYLAWREDKLAFEHASLSDVMDEIERCFNVNVNFASDSLKNKTITGIFASDSVDRVLSIISLTLDIKIIHRGRSITIKNF